MLFVTPWFATTSTNTAESRQGLFEYRQTIEMAKRDHEFAIVTIRWHNQPIRENIGEKIQVYRLEPLYIFPNIRYPIPNMIVLDKK